MLRGVRVGSRSTGVRWGRTRAWAREGLSLSGRRVLGVLSFGFSGGEVLAGLPDAGGRGASVVAAGRHSPDALDGGVHAGVAGTAVSAGRDGGTVAEAGGATAGGGSGRLLLGRRSCRSRRGGSGRRRGWLGGPGGTGHTRRRTCSTTHGSAAPSRLHRGHRPVASGQLSRVGLQLPVTAVWRRKVPSLEDSRARGAVRLGGEPSAANKYRMLLRARDQRACASLIAETSKSWYSYRVPPALLSRDRWDGHVCLNGRGSFAATHRDSAPSSSTETARRVRRSCSWHFRMLCRHRRPSARTDRVQVQGPPQPPSPSHSRDRSWSNRRPAVVALYEIGFL